MQITDEGHIRVSPREVCERLDNPARLINDVLIAGTPFAFPSYKKFCDFLACCADQLGVRPKNILVRGSTKLGFSLSPKPEHAWMEMRTNSDLDLAIIDPDYYHYLDREIRMWERNPKNQAFRGKEYHNSIQRQGGRAFYTLRYFDLPMIQCVIDHKERLKELPIEECCGVPRTVDAFIFRDWWALYGRWESDIRDLCKALRDGLPKGGEKPMSKPSFVKKK